MQFGFEPKPKNTPKPPRRGLVKGAARNRESRRNRASSMSLTGNLDPRLASSARHAVIDEHFAELDPPPSSVSKEEDMTDEEAQDWWTDQGIDQSREGRRRKTAVEQHRIPNGTEIEMWDSGGDVVGIVCDQSGNDVIVSFGQGNILCIPRDQIENRKFKPGFRDMARRVALNIYGPNAKLMGYLVSDGMVCCNCYPGSGERSLSEIYWTPADTPNTNHDSENVPCKICGIPLGQTVSATASRKTASAITPGYYLVGHSGNPIEGPFASLVLAEARQPDVKAAAIEYHSGVEDPQWESMKAQPFPYGLNTVNGSRKTSSSEEYSPSAPAEFVADFDKLADALSPYVVNYDDFEGIGPNAPQQLVDAYQALVQRGYANGYFASRKTAVMPSAFCRLCDAFIRQDLDGQGRLVWKDEGDGQSCGEPEFSDLHEPDFSVRASRRAIASGKAESPSSRQQYRASDGCYAYTDSPKLCPHNLMFRTYDGEYWPGADRPFMGSRKRADAEKGNGSSWCNNCNGVTSTYFNTFDDGIPVPMCVSCMNHKTASRKTADKPFVPMSSNVVCKACGASAGPYSSLSKTYGDNCCPNCGADSAAMGLEDVTWAQDGIFGARRKTAELTSCECLECGWIGTVSQLDDLESYAWGIEMLCPNCSSSEIEYDADFVSKASRRTASRRVVAWVETAPGEEWTLQNLQGETGTVQYLTYRDSYEWYIWDSNNDLIEGGTADDRQSAMDEVARRISGSSAVASRKTAEFEYYDHCPKCDTAYPAGYRTPSHCPGCATKVFHQLHDRPSRKTAIAGGVCPCEVTACGQWECPECGHHAAEHYGETWVGGGGCYHGMRQNFDEDGVWQSATVASRKTSARIFEETYRGVDIFKDDTHGDLFFSIGWPGESFGNLPDIDLAHEIIDFKIDNEGVVASRRIANDMTDEQDENSEDAKDSAGQAASAVSDLAEVLARRQPLRHFAQELVACEMCGATEATTVILDNDLCIECNGVNDVTWHKSPPIGYFD